MEAECPHCHKIIEMMEPKDLTAVGLTQNVRGPLIESGDLVPWLKLRGDKFFLFLRSNVDDVLGGRRKRDLAKIVKQTNLAKSPEEEERLILALEEALKDGGEPPKRRTRRR